MQRIEPKPTFPRVFGIDWGQGKKLTVYDGINVWSSEKDLKTFIQEYSPCLIVIEPTFESYVRRLHNEVIREAQNLGSQIWTLPTRKTARERLNRNIEKSDENDAKLIYTLWDEKPSLYQGVYFAPARLWEDEAESTRIERIEMLRRRGWPKEGTSEFSQWLPLKEETPDFVKHTCGDGKKLSEAFVLPLIATALDVIESGGNRDDFDRKVGMYGHGYPSLMRSHCYHHRLGALRLRALKKSSSDKKLNRGNLKSVNDSATRKEEMRSLRRATRWFFWHVKQKVSNIGHNTSHSGQ